MEAKKKRSKENLTLEKNNNSTICKLKFLFYWNSSAIQYDFKSPKIWELYPNDIQLFLNQRFEEYLKINDKAMIEDVNLLPPLENYMINLTSCFQYHKFEKSCIREVLIDFNFKNEEMPNSGENSQQTSLIEDGGDSELYQFFWQAKEGVFSTKVPDDWRAYDEKNQIYLNKKYRESKNGENIRLLSPSESYMINFEILLQIHVKDLTKVRPIKIEKLSKQNLLNESTNFSVDENRNSLMSLSENSNKDISFENKNDVKYLLDSFSFNAGESLDLDKAFINYNFYKNFLDIYKKQNLSLIESKEDFIKFCNVKFKEFNASESDLIQLVSEIKNDKFAENQAIKWYLKDSFLSKLLNEILGESDYLQIFKIRYVILKLQQAFTIKSFIPEKTLDTLYKPCFLNEFQINILKQKFNPNIKNNAENCNNNFMQIRGFTYLTANKELADDFTNNYQSRENRKDKFSVLFIVKTREEHLNKIYHINNECLNNNQSMSLKSLMQTNKQNYNDSIFLLQLDALIKINKISENATPSYNYLIHCELADFSQTENLVNDKTRQMATSLKKTISQHFNIDYFYYAEFLIKINQQEKLLDLLNQLHLGNDKIDLENQSIKNNIYLRAYFSDKNKSIYKEKIIEYYQKDPEFMSIIYGKSHLKTANSYFNLANCYTKEKKYEKALQYYKESLVISKENVKYNENTNILIANIYTNIAIVYKHMGLLEKALEFHLISLKLRQQLSDSDSIDIANTFNSIGSTYFSLGSYDNALENFKKAAEIFKKTLGENNTEYGSTLNNIGSVCNQVGKLKEALENFYKALKINEAVLGINSNNTAAVSFNLAVVYSNQLKYDEALQLSFKTLKIFKGLLEADHPNIQNTIKAIKNLLVKKGEKNKATDEYIHHQLKDIELKFLI